MKKLTIEVSGEIEAQYDEASETFQNTLKDYNEMICEATAEQMVRHAVSQLTDWGDHYNMLEGIGYVGLIGEEATGEPDSGIRVSNNYADLNYEIR